MLRRCVSAGERKFAWRVFIPPPEHVLGWGAWLHANDKPDQNEQSECSHSTAGSGEPGMVVPILARSIIHCNGEPPLGTANTYFQRLICERVLLVRPLASSSAAEIRIGGVTFRLRHASVALPCRWDSAQQDRHKAVAAKATIHTSNLMYTCLEESAEDCCYDGI
jgi:hypothetical protein